MRFIIVLTISLLLSLQLKAQQCATCPPANTISSPISANNISSVSDIKTIVTQTCGSTETPDQTKSRIEEIVKSAGALPKKTFSKPTSRTSSSVTYSFPEETLNPKESLYFAIPDDLSKRPIKFFILHHRQDPNTEKGTDPSSKWDSTPGLTSVQILAGNLSGTEQWRYWGGQASGSQGAKFAEVSSSSEIENLYEWQKLGHTGVESGKSSHEALYPSAVRLISMGQDTVKVSQITLKVSPLKPDLLVEGIYSKGTSFGDYESESGRTYGGGQSYKGKFPDAVILGAQSEPTTLKPQITQYQSSESIPQIKNFEYRNGEIHIPLPEGYMVTSVEVADGDSHPDEITNSDGGWGTKGWGRLSVGLKSGNAIDWFLSNENVPPEGVMMGTPTNCDQISKSGDEIIIKGSSDKVYVMGVRVGLKKK